jgi:hypothetical protein
MKTLKVNRETVIVVLFFTLMTAIALLSTSCKTSSYANYHVDKCPTWAKK